ncbi:hypothetical protein ACIQUQ_31545 [Streptomyces sp. NPDC101118]|uniref:hypothetical protein n=1 Tax=Streptomyces sp. NPDC101118 TaxID=3366109 RepID=UPI0038191D07
MTSEITEISACPGAADMSAYTAEFVRRLVLRSRLPLDYSVRSLRIVDRVVDGLRADDADRARMAAVLRGLGAYAGEVFVRQAGARWVDFDETTAALFQQSVGVRMPDGRAWNPLGKVVNRFELGPRESVSELFLLLHGRVRPAEHRQGRALTGCGTGRPA